MWSDGVVLLVLEVHACIAKDDEHFHQLVLSLVQNFRGNNTLLEKRGALIIRRLCVPFDAETLYRKLSSILEKELDLYFAAIMVQLDKLIWLLETPIFAYMRLQLLEPQRHIRLSKALYGLLMLLP
ncbi:hypothetical protein Droror1_Dr00016491 [Drosera rotundifolia]